MLNLLSASTVIGEGGWIGLLVQIAIICVIIWAVWALLQWSGIAIPEPVRIVLIALVCIVLIIWLAKLVMMVL